MKKLVIDSPHPHQKSQATVHMRHRETYMSWVLWPLWLVVSYTLALLVSSVIVDVIAKLSSAATTTAPMMSMGLRMVVYVLLVMLFIYVPLYMVTRATITKREMGLGCEMRWRDILYGIAGFVVFMAVAFIVMQLASHIPGLNVSEVQDLGLHITYGFDRMAAFVLLVMITPFFEEWIFRGALYGKLRSSRMPWWLAMIVVSVLFGVAHGQWNVGITTFCMSMVACGLRERTGTIWAGVILHMIKNLIAFYVTFVMGTGA